MEKPMRITLSVIKADIGSIGGHIAPSRRLLEVA
jgi:fructose 1,6-bisphosphatase